MKILPFKSSSITSIGTELECQLINPHTYALASRAKELIRHIKASPLQQHIKPEITQSMIEINSSVHQSVHDLSTELLAIQAFLLEQCDNIALTICGGGTHAFQKWSVQKIFPTIRFKHLSRQYRYLSKRSTVFGQHIHVGCKRAEEAIYLTHALARYVPHFIAISASSPYYQGIDTGFHSSRSTVFNAFPQSGVMPYLTDWQAFSAYFYKMRNIGIVKTMKDFYWDIRPKPELGTVEIRVMDTPLTMQTALINVAYVQSLANYLLHEKPITVSHDLYYVYNYNRFQASRYGLEGDIIDATTLQRVRLQDDIVETLKHIERYANQLNNMAYLSQLFDRVANNQDDATHIRQIMKEVNSLPELVHQQCDMWANN